jgi:hypothetical protein
MRLSLLSSFVYATSTLASPYVLPRDASQLQKRADPTTVAEVLNKVSGYINDLTKKTKAFDGDAINAVPILDGSSAIQGAIKNGSAQIMSFEPMGLIDTIAILGTVYTLNTAVDNLVTALIEKRGLFDKAFVTIVVKDQLDSQLAGAKALVDAVIARLPAYIPGIIGTTVASPIISKLEKAVAAFEPNATPAAASSPAAAKPTSTAKSSSSPRPTRAPKSNGTPKSSAPPKAAAAPTGSGGMM